VHDGDALLVLGATAPEVGGSEWATAHGLRGGRPPAADLDAAVAVHELVRALVNDRVVRGVHDCSEGGLAVTVAEMAIAGECGVRVAFDTGIVPALAWFSESTSRVVISVSPDGVDAILERADSSGVPAVRLGTAGGDRIVAHGAFSVSLAAATAAWRDAIPNALGHKQSPPPRGTVT
jgi:phosphoribosylformylglycinamidine synthase